MVQRRALPRTRRTVSVLGHDVGVKVVTLPDGTRRGKPEFDDVRAVAHETGRPVRDIFHMALQAAERD
jgi:uncharacterized protein (DUF111 family)